MHGGVVQRAVIAAMTGLQAALRTSSESALDSRRRGNDAVGGDGTGVTVRGARTLLALPLWSVGSPLARGRHCGLGARNFRRIG